jgi:hypothetical protein
MKMSILRRFLFYPIGVIFLSAFAIACGTSSTEEENGELGTFAIHVDSSNVQAAGLNSTELEHTLLIVDSTGREVIRRAGIRNGSSETFSVTPGLYHFSARAYHGGIVRAIGSRPNIEIKTGDNGHISIPMTEPNFIITMQSGGNGTATAVPEIARQGTDISISTTPNTGYRFNGWEVVSGGVTLSSLTASPATFTMPGNNVTIRASFAPLSTGTPNLAVLDVSFSPVIVGYAQPAALTVTVTNSSPDTAANVSSIVFGGTNASAFALDGHAGIASIAAGGNATFTVRPALGLGAGTYTGIITVTYDGGRTATANLSFEVNEASPGSHITIYVGDIVDGTPIIMHNGNPVSSSNPLTVSRSGSPVSINITGTFTYLRVWFNLTGSAPGIVELIKTSSPGDPTTVTLDAAANPENYPIGTHYLMIEVEVDGLPYQANIPFKVVE